jgi:hypothetical protein
LEYILKNSRAGSALVDVANRLLPLIAYANTAPTNRNDMGGIALPSSLEAANSQAQALGMSLGELKSLCFVEELAWLLRVANEALQQQRLQRSLDERKQNRQALAGVLLAPTCSLFSQPIGNPTDDQLDNLLRIAGGGKVLFFFFFFFFLRINSCGFSILCLYSLRNS